MKLKVFIVMAAVFAGAFIAFRGVFNGPTDIYRELLLENIEALADDGETGSESVDCVFSGSVVCPEGGARVLRVEYFSIRNEVSLY